MDVTAVIEVQEAIALAMENSRSGLLGYLGRLLGNAADAEDVFQETAVRALQAKRQAPAAELRPWLFRIATNRALDLIRRRRKTAEVDALEAPGPGVEQHVETRITLRAVRQFVDALPPKQRAAFILRRYEGTEYAEIGAALGCSEDSARANAYQALKRLREHFLGRER